MNMRILVCLSILIGAVYCRTHHGIALPCHTEDCDGPISIGKHMLNNAKHVRYSITINSAADKNNDLPDVTCRVKEYQNLEKSSYTPCEVPKEDVPEGYGPQYRSKNGFSCVVNWVEGAWDFPSVMCKTDAQQPVKYSWTINGN